MLNSPSRLTLLVVLVLLLSAVILLVSGHEQIFGYPKDRFLYRPSKGDRNDFIRWIGIQFRKCYGQNVHCNVRQCRYGLRVNSHNGCPRCHCNLLRPLRIKKCHPRTCANECQSGYERDRHGCLTCDCLEE